MFGNQKGPEKPESLHTSENGKPAAPAVPLLTVVGDRARMEGKFDIADSIQVECEIGGELNVGGKFVIGEKGSVNANVQTVDAIVMGHYAGNMIATGNVAITETGRVTGNIIDQQPATGWGPKILVVCCPRQDNTPRGYTSAPSPVTVPRPSPG